MNRCTRCVMPDTVPGLTFDDAGVCDYCRDYRQEHYLGEGALELALAQARQSQGRYNCIVPLSGGRDSTFVLYTAKVSLGLRPLAVNYDNEFRVPQAIVNMQTACNRLGVDLDVVRCRKDLASRIVKNEILSSVSFGKFSMCRACCHGYKSAAYRAAQQHKTPAILWGESQAERTVHMTEKAFAGIRSERSPFLKLLRSSFYTAEYYALLQRLEMRVPGHSLLNRGFPVLPDGRIKQLRLFDYLRWDSRIISDTIMSKLGWEKPSGARSTWRTDCKLPPLLNYVFAQLVGCTKGCFGYCNMINNGTMTRQEALEQEEYSLAHLRQQVRPLLENIIGLPGRKVEAILAFQGKLPEDRPVRLVPGHRVGQESNA